ncbi:winged helix-turn-helix domain-containing protein [Psychrobium sp. 1_MG-2023]|uniref:winged helix-turn-helix domain-containing protein n=1 Tax=Psychrobium sp. 1_MG-2023 TaxID=3062624 RepID=UPI000C32DAC3|nr:winged helix-turn-helix domain-containing protein [Psychrobium sp. 1_MG-2023]MDP2562697.1 winged helix-turn-helix domain-containing protein [Psychrobium sp. 1_MG-2023]PKF54790.1 hypothetical protein CW748_15315 [Alteromonadales bacterium alter-6D02]
MPNKQVAMQYIYENYCFDQESLTLYHNNQPKALKSNEAKLLALFLENQDKILSKEHILSQVWGEQVVSEQVVFQNISQLRQLFGRDAIKTFSKKGYQWQRPFELAALQDKSSVTTSETTGVPKSSYVFLSACIAVVLVALLVYFTDNEQLASEHNSRVYLIPFSIQDDTEATQLDHFNRQMHQHNASGGELKGSSSINTRMLFTYPEESRQAMSVGTNVILLSGFLYTHDGQMSIEYKLFGHHRNWSGYLTAPDQRSLVSSLKATVEAIEQANLLNEPNSALVSSKLNLLLAQQPENMSVVHQLLLQQVKEQNYDVANALAEKLIQLAGNKAASPYRALGLYVKGAIYHQQQKFIQAKKFYNHALDLAPQKQFVEVRHKIELSLAWLAYAQHTPKRMQQHIENAAKYAQQKKAVLAHASAYTTGSILSHKLGDVVNRYQYLNTAKSLLLTHQVSQAHSAVIHYHLGLFAPSKAEAESYYLKVLGLPKLNKYQWIYESATEELMSWYIDKSRWQEAFALFELLPQDSFNLIQQARLLRAKQDNIAAIALAKRAFEQARLNYEYNNALHGALLLFQLQGYMNDPNTPDYQDYIKRHASAFWLEKHKAELTELGYFDGTSHQSIS